MVYITTVATRAAVIGFVTFAALVKVAVGPDRSTRPAPRAGPAAGRAGNLAQTAALPVNQPGAAAPVKGRSGLGRQQRQKCGDSAGSQIGKKGPAADLLAKLFNQLLCSHLAPPIAEL